MRIRWRLRADLFSFIAQSVVSGKRCALVAAAPAARTAGFSLLLLVAAGGHAVAEPPDAGAPQRVESHHSLQRADGQLAYDAIAETLPLHNDKGVETASIFTVSYVAAGPGRPVSFVFNGGPGAASVFLHLGALGPRVLDTPSTGASPAPPYRLVDNRSSWLPFTDLVFVDPVGTGFSRGEGKAENPDKPFWAVHDDIVSLGTVVRLWLTRHQRWQSPIFLVGESYGGFRAAVMAHELVRQVGVTVSGVALISPALDLSLISPGGHDLVAAALALPSYAATAAALRGTESDTAAVERFALSDYLAGLAGMRGEPGRGDPFIAKVAAMVGLPEDVLRRNRGRVPAELFARRVRRSEGQVVSLYDGTVAIPVPSGDSEAGDPVLDPAVAAYTSVFNVYVRDWLGYKTDQPYQVLAADVSRHWDWEGERGGHDLGPALSGLEAALQTEPNTRVLIVNGRYDLVTPYFASRWLVDQLSLPPKVRDGIELRVYEGGHMMYMRPPARAALAQDAARLYAGSPPTP
jgi:carboxypeptidase C (cathepsin A)